MSFNDSRKRITANLKISLRLLRCLRLRRRGVGLDLDLCDLKPLTEDQLLRLQLIQLFERQLQLGVQRRQRTRHVTPFVSQQRHVLRHAQRPWRRRVRANDVAERLR